MTMMKTRHLFFSAILFTLASCGGGSSETSDEATDSTATVSDLPASLQRGSVEADLSDYFVNATITIPDESRGEHSITANDFGETRIKVGTIYDVIIAELIEGDLNSHIQMLNEDITFTNEIVEQGDDYILYKSSIANSSIDPVFHFYAIKTFDGIAYEIHDYNEEGGYAESVARMMMESVNYMKANNNPS